MKQQRSSATQQRHVSWATNANLTSIPSPPMSASAKRVEREHVSEDQEESQAKEQRGNQSSSSSEDSSQSPSSSIDVSTHPLVDDSEFVHSPEQQSWSLSSSTSSSSSHFNSISEEFLLIRQEINNTQSSINMVQEDINQIKRQLAVPNLDPTEKQYLRGKNIALIIETTALIRQRTHFLIKKFSSVDSI